jgi:sugar O-acyltransferase (sialic acid O-acetyltransferase NeuD family)
LFYNWNRDIYGKIYLQQPLNISDSMDYSNLLLAGGGGHALDILANLPPIDPSKVVIYDQADTIRLTQFGFRHVQNNEELKALLQVEPDFIITVGKPHQRKFLFELLTGLGGQCSTFVAPSAVVGNVQVSIGVGCNIMANCFISSNTRIGIATLINAAANIHHDCTIGDFCDIGPGVLLLGNSHVGNEVWIGAGAIILPGLSIGDRSIVGAGAVVTKNVAAGEKVIGVPARFREQLIS